MKAGNRYPGAFRAERVPTSQQQGAVLLLVLIFLMLLSALALGLFRSGTLLEALAHNRWRQVQVQMLARSGVAWVQAQVATGGLPTPVPPSLVQRLGPPGGALQLQWHRTQEGHWQVRSVGRAGHIRYTVWAMVRGDGTLEPGSWWEAPGAPP